MSDTTFILNILCFISLCWLVVEMVVDNHKQKLDRLYKLEINKHRMKTYGGHKCETDKLNLSVKAAAAVCAPM